MGRFSQTRDGPAADAAVPGGAESVWEGVRGGVLDALELLRVRLALLSVEAAAHALDVARGLAWTVAAAVLLALGLGFLAALLTVVLWDSHRVLALAVLASLFLAGGVTAALAARRIVAGVRWFEASLAELARDRERLRGQS